MTNIVNLARQLAQHEGGQDLIEYALLACVVSLGIVTAIPPVAQAIGKLFAAVSAALSTAG